jgi:hypothetical protein
VSVVRRLAEALLSRVTLFTSVSRDRVSTTLGQTDEIELKDEVIGSKAARIFIFPFEP